jgi:hypothetical protein
MTYYIVWNESKTEGFATVDSQLAYEVRKGSDTNCFDADGNRSDTGIAFIEAWGDDNCTIEQVGPDPVPEAKSLEQRHAEYTQTAKAVNKLRMNSTFGKIPGLDRFAHRCAECGNCDCNGECGGDDMMGSSS